MQNMFFFAGPKKRLPNILRLLCSSLSSRKKILLRQQQQQHTAGKSICPLMKNVAAVFIVFYIILARGGKWGVVKKSPFLRGPLEHLQVGQIRWAARKRRLSPQSVRQCLHDRGHKKGVGSRRGKKKARSNTWGSGSFFAPEFWRWKEKKVFVP